MVITVSCPSCSATFPVDANKVPVGGVSARCSSCGYIFRVERPTEEAPRPSAEPLFDAPTSPGGGDWVLERDEDIDAGGLNIEPLDAVESPAVEAGTDEPIGPDLADPMALPAEPADSFFAARAPEPAPEPESPAVTGFSFGKRDPKDRARRLARVLVSDMISYNPERHERALANGSLKADFEEEIQKSWKEYVEQVGEEMASENPFWVEALNDVLAKGEHIF